MNDSYCELRMGWTIQQPTLFYPREVGAGINIRNNNSHGDREPRRNLSNAAVAWQPARFSTRETKSRVLPNDKQQRKRRRRRSTSYLVDVSLHFTNTVQF